MEHYIINILKTSAMELKDIVKEMPEEGFDRNRLTPLEYQVGSKLQKLKRDKKIICKKINGVFYWGLSK